MSDAGSGVGMDATAALPVPVEVTIRESEDRAFRAWPSETTQDMSGWIVRHEQQASTRRANSVYPVRLAANVDPDTVLQQVEAHYADHGAPARFQISPASLPGDLDERLRDRGYGREAATVVEWATVQEISRAPQSAPPAQVMIADDVSDAWAEAYGCGLESDQNRDARLAVIRRINQPKALAKLTVEDHVQAVGLGVYDTGWTGVFCMFTKPEGRQKGYAHLILDALAHWTVSLGGSHMYLQVEEDNLPARTFYEGRGFRHAYGYHYRTL